MNAANTCADVCTATAKPASKARKLPFPHLPSPGTGTQLDFWLAAWSRETAKLEALAGFNLLQSTRKTCDRNERLLLALIGSEISLRHSAESSLEMLHNQGGLLFAFAESAKFTPGGAA